MLIAQVWARRAARRATCINHPLCRYQSTHADRKPYWQGIPQWSNVPEDDFLSYNWQLRNSVKKADHLYHFLRQAVPDTLRPSQNPLLQHIRTKDQFIADVAAALKEGSVSMAMRITPHILSRIAWENALDDPIRRQFIPMMSAIMPNHAALTLDSLCEEADSPTKGLVHRYEGRVLFLALSTCPVYCRFCTRSYAVGEDTNTVSKKPQKPSLSRWHAAFEYIRSRPDIEDVVISGGDSYSLHPQHLQFIGETLLGIKHVRRMRFASKGLAVAPCRITDPKDEWANTMIELSNQGRRMGKQACLHTHFNHPKEITWATEDAANHLFAHGVIVRNQSVLLKGVNDDFKTMGTLIKHLARMNIQPYYVYQCDLVPNIEDLRTDLRSTIELDKKLRGTLSGFMMPAFVVDLPGGGGKRLVSTYEKYENGIATYKAPGLPGDKGSKEYLYFDPKHNPSEVRSEESIQVTATTQVQRKLSVQDSDKHAHASYYKTGVQDSVLLKHRDSGFDRKPSNLYHPQTNNSEFVEAPRQQAGGSG